MWTAEMILLFCLQRSDIFSFDDLAIQRGLRMVYRHRKIDRKLFEKYRRRFSPYGSVASLYLWGRPRAGLSRAKKTPRPGQKSEKITEEESARDIRKQRVRRNCAAPQNRCKAADARQRDTALPGGMLCHDNAADAALQSEFCGFVFLWNRA